MKPNNFQKGSLIAALDIGSHKNVCLIARMIDDHGGMEILGVGHHSSKGVKNGLVTDMQAAENAIRQTVHAAENMAANAMKGYPLRDVILGISDNHLTSETIQISLDLPNDVVEDKDIHYAVFQAQQKIDVSQSELIHTIPYSFNLDQKGEVQHPVGMRAETLDLNVHTVYGDLKYLNNLAAGVEKSHLDIVCLASSAYASGLSCLVEDEMDLGCILIDMGAGSTSFAIFENGQMIYSAAIPIGGWHVSNDIAKGLNCSLNDAERIKTLYGSAMVTAHDDAELIDVPQVGETDSISKNHVPRSLLIGMIQPRLEEIFEMIRDQLNLFQEKKQLGRRVVITGGGSQMPGVRDLCQIILDKQVRIGKPIHISNLPDAASGPAFSTAAGLLNYYAFRQNEVPAEIAQHVEATTIWIRFKNWWKENW